ncbi:type II secretion system minor pseudopilin GspJ [Idiomarina sp. M1R2S28]|uniref:Type II secretion system protein J n=1 Tax=Idiomarina rhizosphaerae TaxID=2961572 RepID=A0A9X2G3B3_9GAMM|nr:type II secretion system minor pseudopilin GspJ [Idiomarina rhizosphaerae]MCP1339198.1 type II secretion system minor pseudopilin GspJ [Idiomarina rhizosphaerae]
MSVNAANKGFTLVEVLVTMVIFAIIGIASFQVLNQMVNTEEQSQKQREQLERLQFSQLLIQQDIRQMVAKPTRPSGVEVTHQYLSNDPGYFDSDGGVLAFVRSGFDNPGNMMPRSELQPVVYRLWDGNLQRVTETFVNDRSSEPSVQTLLEGVEELSFRFYRSDGVSNANQGLEQGWSDSWESSGDLPQAVEVTIRSKNFGTIRRVFLIAAVGQQVESNSGGLQRAN